MKKKLFFTGILNFILLSTVFSQYVNHYQGFYDYDNGTVDNNCITNAINEEGYVMAPFGYSSNSMFFGLLKVQNDFTLDWSTEYKVNYYSNSKDIITDYNDDSYVVCGKKGYSYWGNLGAYIHKYNSNGDIQWVVNYDSLRTLNSIIVVEDNSEVKYMCCGMDMNYEAIIMGISNDGDVVWANKTNYISDVTYNDLVQVNENDIIAIGNSSSYGDISIVTRISSNGNIVFSKKYNSSINNRLLEFNSVTYNDEYEQYMGIMIEGKWKYVSDSINDICYLKLNFSDGNITLANSYNIISSKYNFGRSDIYKLKGENEIVIVNDKHNPDISYSDTNGYILVLDTMGKVSKTTLFTGNYNNSFSKIVRNNNNDGYVLGGYTMGYKGKQRSPYIAEVYDATTQDCESEKIIVKTEKISLNIDTISTIYTNVYYTNERVQNVNLIVREKVICDKVEYKESTKRLANNDQFLDTFVVTPTVSEDYINIGSVDTKYNYTIYSINGKSFRCKSNIINNNEVVDIRHISSGVYIIKLYTNDKVIVKKFIKK